MRSSSGGLSIRDAEDAIRDATSELRISKSAVSEITDRLWADCQAFVARDLSSIEVEYLCWFHRLAKVGAELPDETASEVLAHVYAVRDPPTFDAAQAVADRFANTYRREYSAAVGYFSDDLEALLAIHRVPVRHLIRVRTTNLGERSFVEERHRTKVIPRLMEETPRLFAHAGPVCLPV
jgi:transposase-like protein